MRTKLEQGSEEKGSASGSYYFLIYHLKMERICTLSQYYSLLSYNFKNIRKPNTIF